MSPTVINKLRNLTTQEKEVIKSVNTSNIQERLISLNLRDYDTPRLHYACPLGFMEVFIEREEYLTMALVDTGSEIIIMPEEIAIKASLTSKKLNINLRAIGGHTTSLVGVSEFTTINMITGEEKNHLFIGKGAVHTILGRPFLADNNVKLKFSHKQGEIFSYPEQDGGQLFLPICNPQAMESSKRKETEETESKSSTRVKTIFLGPNKIPLSAIFDTKNDLNFITQEITPKEDLNISPYTSKSTDKSLKPIGQIKNLEVTFESEETTYLEFLVFENFNQIIFEENSSILSSSKESMPAVTHIKSRGKESKDKMEVEDSEAIEKIKEELKAMR
ncbi:hypothetical protein O181_039183 [Austropuccinia psidii MF-1]|uniref:Peptidase A2 domain-containing protein n=1 Tax=Austropuccinia psidii MF-1 TaxID=1389203 RepID=A0A9Q3DEV3_9BASI|nr:hypothetical protein [Austropuccinia psidii MF-1]